MWCVGVLGASPSSLKQVKQLCGCAEAPLSLLSAHMEAIVAVQSHHIKTSGHYLADLLDMSAFVAFVEKIYGENWKQGVVMRVIDLMNKAIEGTKMSSVSLLLSLLLFQFL